MHCGFESFARREFESQLRRIDIVIGAVIKFDFEIHHWIACEKTFFRRFNQTFLDGRNVVLRDRAAEDAIDELKALAAPKRCDPYPAVAELPMAAGLLLVTALNIGCAANGFAIRNLRSFQRDIHVKTFP